MHEARLHPVTSFLTLTYDDEHVPNDHGLHYEDVRLFWKRLRNHSGPFRYFVAGEYGTKHLRPHWHAIAYGTSFDDLRPAGGGLYSSKTLQQLWGKGFASVGNLTIQSARYVAKYTLKKRTAKGEQPHARYERVDPDTGESWYVKPEFARMSNRPGIGAGWYDRYFESDVLPHEAMLVQGKPHAIPRYYLQRLERLQPEVFAKLKESRRLKAQDMEPEMSSSRLAAREAVAIDASKRRQSKL